MSAIDILSAYDRNSLPSWANYIAIDSNGWVFVYQYKPVAHGSYWMGSGLKRIAWTGYAWFWAYSKMWKDALIPLHDNIDKKYSGE